MAFAQEEIKQRRILRNAVNKERRQLIAERNAYFANQFQDFQACIYARPRYEYNTAVVHRHAEGSIIYRKIYALTEEAVWAAHDDFIRNHPFNKPFYMMPRPRNLNDMFSPPPAQMPKYLPAVNKWTLSFYHWSEYL
jgi:hypothetical protein